MIAVVAVIADHVLQWPSGGFVGVDVFFVISGFLITSLLLREHDTKGTISFWGFYRRRIKRIIPAAMIVIVATVFASYLLFNTVRFERTFDDGLWATVFGANWHYAIEGTDYFGATAAVSPLQHYWSLSVEEQFYFVWPWLMLLIFWIVARTRGTAGRARAVAFTAIAVITVGSFSWAMWDSVNDPTVAYFSTFSRTWELGLGAALAVVSQVIPPMAGWLRTTLAWAGLIGIGVSLFVVTDTESFPAPWALLPVASTCLVILAGVGEQPKFIAPISNPVASYIGDISYSLYLWHFPVAILLLGFMPAGWGYRVTALIIIVVLSVASYHLVEDPVRKSSWLEPAAKQQRTFQERMTVPAVAGLATVTALLVVVVTVHHPDVDQSVAEPHTVITLGAATATPGDTKDPLIAELGQRLDKALDAKTWPQLTPTMDEVLAHNPGALRSKCVQVERPSDPNECSWGKVDAPIQIVLVGDSTSAAYARSFQAITERRDDVRVTVWSMNGCPFSTERFENADPDVVKACPGRVADAIKYIQQEHPTLVVITNNYGGSNAETGSRASDQEWVAGLTDAVNQIKGSTQQLIYLSHPPVGEDPGECYTPMSTPHACVSSATDQSTRTVRADRTEDLITEAGGRFIESTDLVCAHGQCPAFVDSIPIKVDSIHISGAFATYISPIIEHMLVPKVP